MPIFEYECTSCGAREEHLELGGEKPKTKCARCGKRLERVIAGASFHLKGGGWYKDGYASSKGGGKKKDD